MNSFLVSGIKEECCGCRACVNICTHKALNMVADEEGFYFPTKNNNCISCGLCEIVCPYNPLNIEKHFSKQNAYRDMYPKTFAAYSEEDRIGSSSGGIFYALAKYIIDKNGYVYGAAFNEDFQLHHIVAHSIPELNPLRGSKYLQSNTKNTYSEVRERLNRKENVLFVGTPCQVAGLKSYLRKDYETLFTADLICHGTPNQWMFDQHNKFIEKENKSKLTSYHF